MQPFTYTNVTREAEAIGAVVPERNAAFLAGGTTLLDLMKLDVMNPAKVVDINAVPMARIEPTDKGVRIGANVRNSDLAYDETIRTRYPALSEALLSGATPQLRNMATVGGNLLQRTRCYYFRDTHSPCNKRQPGSGCSALEGYNRIHAVLGTSDKCIAAHPSDMCVALAAFDAVVHTDGLNGPRAIPIASFHVAYGDDPARESVLEHGELITAVELPAEPFFAKSHYLKVRDRASYEFALASASVALEIADGAVKQARIALGGVATKPWRALEAEKILVGAQANDDTWRDAANVALRDAKPRKQNAFKVELAKRTIHRALQTVAAMGQGEERG